jgi:hypothetical protein
VSSHVRLVLPSHDGKAAPKIVPPRLRIPCWKGLGADSEEKREPVSDIDIEVVDSLKVLDPERPYWQLDPRNQPLGFSFGLHTHPGFDAAYLLEGDLTVLERGQPRKAIHTGQSWHVRPDIVHEVKVGDRTTKVLALYVVEKGKPLATPWQPPQSN